MLMVIHISVTSLVVTKLFLIDNLTLAKGSPNESYDGTAGVLTRKASRVKGPTQTIWDLKVELKRDTEMDIAALNNRIAAHQLETGGTPLSTSIVSGLFGIADVLSIFLTGLVILLLYEGTGFEKAQLYISALTIASLMIVIAFYFSDLYSFHRVTSFESQLRSILTTCALVFLVLAAFGFALKVSAQFSRVWAFSWFLSSTGLICIVRASSGILLRRWARTGRLSRNIVILGASEQAKRLIDQLNQANEPWNRIVAVFDDRSERDKLQQVNYPIRGNVDDLLRYARRHRVDDIVIAMPWSAEQRILEVVGRLSELPVHVHLGADLAGFDFPPTNFSAIGGVSMLDVAYKPLSGWKQVTKHAEDKILALILLILLSPLMLVIALLIRNDSRGPVLFRQRRYGFNNEIFSVYKFRTMYCGDEFETGARQATRNDSRVTRIGKILRRTSLDELPQLFNVLQGEMSLVGPRPHAVPHNEEYAVLIHGYFARHRVKPGITGWAQVNNLRGETEDPKKMRARVEYDIDYIEHWSLLFDLKILGRTCVIVWFQNNAY